MYDELCNAIVRNDYHKLSELVEQHPELASHTWEAGTTPLTIAAEEGHPKIIHLLIRAGANPNDCVDRHWLSGRTTRGMVPIMFARTIAAIDALVEVGADVNCKDAEGKSAFLHIGEMYEIDLIERMIDHGAKPSAGEIAHLYKMAAAELEERQTYQANADLERIRQLESTVGWCRRFLSHNKDAPD